MTYGNCRVTILSPNGVRRWTMERRGVSGTSRQVSRIHYKVWTMMAASLSLPLIIARHPNSIRFS